jgi:molybdate transport system substrate-binding protein
MLNRIGRGLGVIALALGLGALPAAAAGQDLLVFAAASLKNALDDVNAQYQADTGKTAVASYAGSSALAKQIEQAAPADVFISADLDWMDYLAGKNLIQADTRADLLGNSIVLIGEKGAKPIAIAKGFPLAATLGDGRLAMADPSAVPAGKYGKAALQSLGVWDAVESKVAAAENVRAALALVARGEAPLGIVYRTDAAIEPQVRVVATFPESSHPRIVYPAAVMAQSKNPAAGSFYAFLSTPAAAAIFERYGFTVLNAAH